jgi:catechol 1,2-dioxygenase
VAGAPVSDEEVDMRDLTEDGETLVVDGVVSDVEGNPIQGAIVDVWHANTKGGYSHFDPSQPKFNYRRRVRTGSGGNYRIRTTMPSGYAVPPGGATEQLLDKLGRHGRRPAHIHFFVSGDGFRHLTTQINIQGDPDIYEDFAYATREELIPELKREDRESRIRFDFVLTEAREPAEQQLSARPRMSG